MDGLLLIRKRPARSERIFKSRIDEEAQLLANRIALLKQEEVKTWKKIEETRKRANEVKMLKRKNEERVVSVGAA